MIKAITELAFGIVYSAVIIGVPVGYCAIKDRIINKNQKSRNKD